MARFLKPLVRSGGYYPSRRWTPLVYPGGYTTANGGEEPAPPPVEKTVIGNPIHILDALAKPVQALSVKLEPIQAGSGDPSPTNIRPISGWTGANVTRAGKNLIDLPDAAVQLTVNINSAYNPLWSELDGRYAENTQYTFSCSVITEDTSKYWGLSVLYTDGTSQYLWIHQVSTNKKSVTTASGKTVAKIIFAFDTTFNLGFSDAQLELGSTATAHELYQGQTYSITFPSSAGTVYGGTLDVTQGKLTVDKVAVTIDGNNIKFNQITQYGTLNRFGFAYPSGLSAKYSGNTTYCIADKFTPSFNNTIGITKDRPEGYYCFPHSSAFFVSMPSSTITSIAEANAWAGDNTPKVVYELATPLTIQLTAQQVELLQGENNLFSDGEMTLVYLADGNASDVEALNILLGGRYVNNHEADEPTDREALDIVLGGKK